MNYNGTATIKKYASWRPDSSATLQAISVRITPKRVASATRTWDRAGNEMTRTRLMSRVALVAYRSNDRKIAWERGE